MNIADYTQRDILAAVTELKDNGGSFMRVSTPLPDGTYLAGTSGTSGINGSNGSSGISIIGPRGFNGSSGTSGDNGYDGWDGSSGTSGISIKGSSGTSGMNGSTIFGMNGSSGTSGSSNIPESLLYDDMSFTFVLYNQVETFYLDIEPSYSYQLDKIILKSDSNCSCEILLNDVVIERFSSTTTKTIYSSNYVIDNELKIRITKNNATILYGKLKNKLINI